ncbi:MAG: transglutaminase family protein [Sneathiellaceae bacterium]
MGIEVALNHRTVYDYDRPVLLGPQTVRLRPAPHCRTVIPAYSLKVEPREHFLNWQQDPHGNYLARLVFPEPTKRFSIEIDLIADMTVINPFDFFLEPEAESFPFTYGEEFQDDLGPFLQRDNPGPLFKTYLASLPEGAERTIDFLVAVNQMLQRDIAYTVRLEPGVQTPEETLKLRKGSCRDTGWLLVQLMRHRGLAARFVSGYLIQLQPDQKPLDGPEGPTADFTDLHAWAEVFLPGAGWVGLDPTSGLLTGEGHVPLASTPEPSSAAPISGAVEKAEVEFSFEMSVTRIVEKPRVTKPFTEEQWAAILAMGDAVDADLTAGDVRLTMGGEPTFVSVDDMDHPQWNTAALGADKRRLAGELFRRLSAKFAANGLLHYGQGKWYPGEQLPRWALTALWRKDGEAVWQDGRLLAQPEQPGKADAAAAEALGQAIAEELEVSAGHLQPAFEDPYYYIFKERRLPINVTVAENRLSDEMERARIAKVFEQGLDKVVGYALPLGREEGRWTTGPWNLRMERLFLLPGDSAMGYRLPLDSLPWVTEADYPYHFPEDPFAPRGALPAYARLSPADAAPAPAGSMAPRRQSGDPGLSAAHHDSDAAPLPRPGESDPTVLRTALCIEPRDGHCHLFLPPMETAEDYLALIAAIERAASRSKQPVVIEGYLPPADPRLESFSVTPDPGVIEVNIHPSRSWKEMVERTELVYGEARQSRLGTEKFMIDGRHTGTGGGNHVVLGGPAPEDSPFLRRPDLLRSLLGFWQNHPALSYLFSGLFIGPTSQHPRVDEAREDSLYELELAFAQAGPGRDVPPWMTDRLFRNLLVDITGNTHRAEFCIDKLYSPDSSGGRRGLLELRAFEMPPHHQMSSVQMLLLRALLAQFWNRPYDRPPVRWGNRLHDVFLLPHFVWRDMLEVIAELERGGHAFDPAWLVPQMEFRFPRIGRVTRHDVGIELRHALEPWHVMGEEGMAGTTARAVDSTLERVQVSVANFTPERFVLACNGAEVPLQATEVEGEYVGGVRFKAWSQPSSLHPTLPVQAPLTFDLYDLWSGRSLGGCRYHVAHPGGRSFDTLPVNAAEAESRRRTRFFPFGHTGGPMPVPVAYRSAEAPLTLDLRRAAVGLASSPRPGDS